MRQVPIEKIPQDGTGRAEVITSDGHSYDFKRVLAQGDSLVGVYTVVEERVSDGGAIAYVDVDRATVLPLSQIASVEVKEFDYGNTALLGAGAVLFVIWAKQMGEVDSPGQDTHYGPGDKGSGGIR